MIKKFVLVFIILVVLIALVFVLSQRREAREQFVQPRLFLDPDGRTTGNALVYLDLGSVKEDEISSLKFEVSRNSIEWIEVGKVVFNQDINAKSAVWDTTEFSSGLYSVRALLQTKTGALFQSTGNILLSIAPTPGATVSDENGTTVFNGSSSTDPDGNVTAWDWDFGDGTNGTGVVVRHNYTDKTRNYSVILKVTDNTNDTSFGYFDLVFINDTPTLIPSTSCGCLSMELDHRQGINFGSGRLGGLVNEYSNPANPNPKIYYGFQIKAKVKGNPAFCYEWQQEKRSWVVNGVPGNASTYPINETALKTIPTLPDVVYPDALPMNQTPFDGTEFGLDAHAYRRPIGGDLKKHEANVIKWVDRPGYHFGVPRASIGTGFEHRIEFKSIVGGSGGECRCHFTVQYKINGTTGGVDIPAAGSRALNKVDPGDNVGCTFNP